MGGRGKSVGGGTGSVGSPRIKQTQDHWRWIQEVSSDRLRRYVARAENVRNQYWPNIEFDPWSTPSKPRDIRSVGYYAKKELERRGE
jgi:hypothetical protein